MQEEEGRARAGEPGAVPTPVASAAAEVAPVAAAPALAEGNTNGVVFWPVAALVVLVDLATKAMAVFSLPRGIPMPVSGEWLRFTLVYNPGAAFGMSLGPYSRWIFLVLALVVLRVLWQLYRETRDRDNLRTFALALVSSGAVGNVIDRIRSPEGVIDFIDVGVGALRWPTFNVADVAVTCGAALLAWVLWGDEPEAGPAAAPARSTPSHAAADAADAR